MEATGSFLYRPVCRQFGGYSTASAAAACLHEVACVTAGSRFFRFCISRRRPVAQVKFRGPQQRELMHRLDPELRELDAAEASDEIKARIKAREEKMAPLYTQIACEFADLHDRTGRMEAKGVIRKGLEWSRAREFFFHRVTRRVLEEDAIRQLRAADPDLSQQAARATVAGWVNEEDDKAAVAALKSLDLEKKVGAAKIEALKCQARELLKELPEEDRAAAMA